MSNSMDLTKDNYADNWSKTAVCTITEICNLTGMGQIIVKKYICKFCEGGRLAVTNYIRETLLWEATKDLKPCYEQTEMNTLSLQFQPQQEIWRQIILEPSGKCWYELYHARCMT